MVIDELKALLSTSYPMFQTYGRVADGSWFILRSRVPAANEAHYICFAYLGAKLCANSPDNGLFLSPYQHSRLRELI